MRVRGLPEFEVARLSEEEGSVLVHRLARGIRHLRAGGRVQR